MQTIWSRAAQAHGCYCRPCVRAASILARRSATATRSKRPKVAASHVFTACYSAIMATAAVADAAAKDRRRKELDGKLEEARAALARMLAESPAHNTPERTDGAYVLHNANASPLGLYQALTSICEKPIYLLRSVSRGGQRKAYLRRLKDELALLPDEERWLTPRSRKYEVQEAIAREEMTTYIEHREPQNAEQFSKWTAMIDRLVDQLLQETYKSTDGADYTPDLLESAWNNVRMLRSSGYPSYGHVDLDPVTATKARLDLSAVTRNIFRDWRHLQERLRDLRSNKPFEVSGSKGKKMRDPAEMAYYRKKREYFVGKICHNLLIVRALPNFHNYGTLIAGFGALGESRYAQAVVDSFLLHSRMKPSQMVIVALLQHYRMKKDVVGFYNLIRRITAGDRRGLLSRRKSVEDVKADRGLLRWATLADAVVGDGFVTERSRLDLPVIEAVLDGLLDFEQVRHAATILAACLREGCPISAEYLQRVTALCVARADRVAAVMLLRVFLADLGNTTSLIATAGSGRRSILWSLYRLVIICEGNADRHLTLFPRRSGRVVVRGDIGWGRRLRRLRTAIWTACAHAIADDIAVWTAEVDRILASWWKTGPARMDRIYRLLHNWSLRIDRMNLEAQSLKALVRLDWITELCKVYKSTASSLQNDVFNALIRPIPASYRPATIFDRRIPLQERLRISTQILQTMPFVTRVRACFARARELDSTIQAVLRDALPAHRRKRLLRARRARYMATRQLGKADGTLGYGLVMRHWRWYMNFLSRPPQPEQALGDLPKTGASSSEASEEYQSIRPASEQEGFFVSREPPIRTATPAIPVV